MKRLAFGLLLIGSCAVFADVGMRDQGVYVGPVRDIDCAADGGLSCTRDSGVSIARIRCMGATATHPGCITPGDQTLAGKKTWTGRQRIVGAAHGSLTACSSGEKGTWQTCTTHNSPVFCDGTDNHELLGSQADEEVLASVYVNGVPASFFFGGMTLPSTAAWTINALSGQWVAGAGVGTLRLGIIGSAGTCTCDVDCDAPTGRTSCSGTCTFSAGDSIFLFRTSSGTAACNEDPHVAGNLNLMGVAQ